MVSRLSIRRARGLAVAVAATLVLVACGDDVDDAQGGADDTEAPVVTSAAPDDSADTTAPESTAVSAPEPAQVDITLTEFAVEMPAEIPAGFVRLSATNEGEVDHHVIMAKLKDGVTMDELLTAFGTDQAAAEQMIEYRGGPNGIAPGSTESVLVNLDAGEYIAICVIPDAEGTAHAAHGMFTPVTVVGDGAPANLAQMDVEATISLTDFDFTMSEGFDGSGPVLVTVNAPQPHEVAVYKVAEGGSVDELMKVLGGDPSVTPEIAGRYTLKGGLTPIASGTSAIVEFGFDPGKYIFICFVADATDQLPHFLHGMVKMVEIG